MTTVAQYPTLVDVAKRLDPDGRIASIAEVLAKVNPILQDVPMIEGNMPTGHQGTIRTGLPDVAWRLLNYGTLPTKSTTKAVTDSCGILEAFSEIDKEVYRLNGANDAFRASEDVAFLEAMAQELASTLFYGNAFVSPEEFTGLSVRYSDSSGPDNAANVLKVSGATGTSGNTSIWLISWGERSVHGIYPKGSMAGLEYQNLGEQTRRGTDGRLMQVMVSHFIQKFGIHVKDWAGVVRAQMLSANFNAPLTASGTKDPSRPYVASGIGYVPASAHLTTVMHEMLHAVPLRLRAAGGSFNPVFYCSPMVKSAIDLAAEGKGSNTLTISDVENRGPVTKFMGYPIYECDALTDNEAVVS
jgi:hypothetical protein